MFSFPECTTWLAVGLTESVAIVTLNVMTIVVFIRNRHLRMPSTYLVINLAAADMLAGGIAAYDLFYVVGTDCNVWKKTLTEDGAYVLSTLLFLFPLSSITSITAISIERLHATLWPFRHRLLGKVFYVLIIAVIWITAGLVTTSGVVLWKFNKKCQLLLLPMEFVFCSLPVYYLYFLRVHSC